MMNYHLLMQKKSIFHDQASWESKDKELIKDLKNKFGEKPDWFGYGKM